MRATVVKTYGPDLLALAVEGKVAVATITRGAVAVECDQELTDEERSACVDAALAAVLEGGA